MLCYFWLGMSYVYFCQNVPSYALGNWMSQWRSTAWCWWRETSQSQQVTLLEEWKRVVMIFLWLRYFKYSKLKGLESPFHFRLYQHIVHLIDQNCTIMLVWCYTDRGVFWIVCCWMCWSSILWCWTGSPSLNCCYSVWRLWFMSSNSQMW